MRMNSLETQETELSRSREARGLDLTVSVLRREGMKTGWSLITLRLLARWYLVSHSRITQAISDRAWFFQAALVVDNPFASSRLGPRALQFRNLLFPLIGQCQRRYCEWGRVRRLLLLAAGSSKGWYISRPHFSPQ